MSDSTTRQRLATPAPPLRARFRPLRWRLLMLCVAGMLPLVIAAALTVAYVVYERGRALERNALVLARSIGASVQSELDAAVAALESLSDAESLKSGRLAAVRDHAMAVALKRKWRTVTLMDPTGTLLFSTDDPNASGQKAWERASVEEAISRREATVGGVVRGQLTPAPAFPIRVPVIQNDAVRYVLSAVVGTERILDLVKQQRLSESHVVAIFDATGVRIARTMEHVSGRASASLQALIDAGGAEGVGLTRTLEGETVHTAFHRVPKSNWIVAVGVPAMEARNALLASLATALAGLVCSLALSAWLARYFARRVSQPIDKLKRAAAALGRGEHVDEVQVDIEELQEVGAALTQAARDRELASAERERLLAKTVAALQQAEDAARTKDEFLAVLGHELRNPLAPIVSSLRLMELKGDTTTQAERRIIERQLARMTRLVDDLLDVSRITRRQLAIRKVPMQVGPLIERSVEAMQSAFDARRINIELPHVIAQRWILGDPVRLEQVLANLLGNAVRFTSDNGRISVTAREEGTDILIDVADDGVGLSQEQRQQVFDLFYQAPQALDRARGGLGLGLPIVRSLVEMHGGTVGVESGGLDQGSVFTVRLPSAAAPAEPVMTRPSADALSKSPGSLRVLVVDDNQDAADSTAALLEMSGHVTKVAYSPQQALEVAAAFELQVAFLDIGLPGMDGYELASTLRRSCVGGRLRLVALTGYGQAGDVRRAIDAGFDAHLTKPVDPDALLAALV